MGQPARCLFSALLVGMVSIMNFVWTKTPKSCMRFGPRVECGAVITDPKSCESEGCCWSPADAFSEYRRVKLPSCFTSNGDASSYHLSQSDAAAAAGNLFKGDLQQSKATQPELGTDISHLSVSADLIASDILRIKIGDKAGTRWQVPQQQLFGDRPGLQPATSVPRGTLDVAYEKAPFSVTVTQEGKALLQVDGNRFLFKDQYVELNTLVPEEASLFGVGERTPSQGLKLPRDGLPLTLWNRDIPCAQADTNLYGSHPFVMMVLPDGTASGLLLLNSNAMEVSLTSQGISWRAVGGIVDLYVLGGPTPGRVLEQLTWLIGRPHMPPYWSLGFHQCKWGYKTIDEVSEVVSNYSAAGIPLETMWTDIDYMDGWRDFSNDPEMYPRNKFKVFVDKLHESGQRWVPIVDPGIKVEAGDAAYDDGIARDVFLKDAIGNPYIGQVWPGATHYPDFTHPGTQQWWQDHLMAWYKKLPFDGIWIDMNEVSNFCTGDVCEVPEGSIGEGHLGHHANAFQEDPTVCFLRCRTAAEALAGANATDPRLLQVDKPPYQISNGNERLPLGLNTAAMSARHHDGVLQYDSHNLYGLQESRVSHAVMSTITHTRPFVLSRSTFVGSGQWAAHWTGDNGATWDDLRWSITAVLNSGLFGIPFVGADICGFIGNTTEELCNRWISAGAFYPFSRDHSGAYDGYQELYRWKSVAEAGRQALGMRYRLLPYLYTAFHEAHTTGAPVARPLLWADAADRETLSADGQWLLGASVLVSPVLTEGAVSVAAYFPRGTWYSLWDDSIVDVESSGSWRNLAAPLGDVPLHVRGGAVVPMQEGAMTTTAVHSSPLTLVVALAPHQAATQSRLHRWKAAAVRHLMHVAARMLTVALPHSAAALRPRLEAVLAMLTEQRSRGRRSFASGWMFRDEGDPLQVPDALDNFMSFTATKQPADESAKGGHSTTVGAVTMRFGRGSSGGKTSGESVGGGGGDNSSEECSGVSWPHLDSIRVLGVSHHHVDSLSVAVNVAAAAELPAGAGHAADLAATTGGGGTRIPPDQVHYNATTGVLVVTAIRAPLICPHALRVSWSSSATTTAAGTDEL